MQPIILNAHFDGEHIILDEPAELKPDTKLIVTVLPTSKNVQNKIQEERMEWHHTSLEGLEQAYDDSDVAYSLELIKEANPEYEGR